MTIEEIAIKIKNAGGTLYLVGGAIRDKILKRPIKDQDYCVTGITADEFKNLFPEAKIQGKAFEVFILENKEFAMARTEIKTGEGHKEFEVTTGEGITIEKDLERRDLTVNAIAQNVLTGRIIDPFNGEKDIENKKLRAVSDKFKEDPLRVYRVARFAAELEFEVEEETLKMMNTLRYELLALSKERVLEEFRKAIKTNKPSIFFEVLKKANVLDVHYKEIYDLIGAIQPIEHHPEGDSYNHTMLALDNVAKITTDEKIRFATLVHDLGKGRTPKEMLPHHYGHEERGIEPLKLLSKKIGVPTDWKKCGLTAIKEHMRGGIFFKMSVAKQVSFIEKVSKSLLGLEGLQKVVYADRTRTENETIEKEEYNFEKIGKQMLEEINGEYIKKKYKIEPGIEFGKKLHQERVTWLKQVYGGKI